MLYYFAPMEGIAGYLYRNAYHSCFPPMDKYFTPFLSPGQHQCFSAREWNDVSPEHNQGMKVVPQILTNHSGDFIWAAKALLAVGYEEINLNLGCPSGTVVSKGRGAGFLNRTEELKRFLDQIFEAVPGKISIKTRIGRYSPDEFPGLLEIYGRYPLSELIIHPRIQTDIYKNTPNWEVFSQALSSGKFTVCYNGDLNTVRDYQDFTAAYPQVDRTMYGRGLLSDPWLMSHIKKNGTPNKEKIREFHTRLLEGYQSVISGDRNLLFKMKEVWHYLSRSFTDSEKYLKKIRKADHLGPYLQAVDALFHEQELVDLDS